MKLFVDETPFLSRMNERSLNYRIYIMIMQQVSNECNCGEYNLAGKKENATMLIGGISTPSSEDSNNNFQMNRLNGKTRESHNYVNLTSCLKGFSSRETVTLLVSNCSNLMFLERNSLRLL